MHDLIFWYTGGAVWALIGAVIGLLVVLGLAWGVRYGVRSIAEWVGCTMLLRQFKNKAEREALYRILQACGIPHGTTSQEFGRWAHRVYRYTRQRYPELIGRAEDLSTQPWRCYVPEAPESLPPRDHDDYYRDRYSQAVQLRGFPNSWRWDYNQRGWVDAHCSGGPDPDDYNVPVKTPWRFT